MFQVFVNEDDELDTIPQTPKIVDDVPEINKDELLSNLSPREREIIDSVIVDGYEDREEEEREDDTDYLNSLTLDDIEMGNDSFLETVGFVDPDKLDELKVDSDNLDRIIEAMEETQNEIIRLESAGVINQEKARQLDTFLHGRISDTIAMESFTQLPTKTNHRLVLEELNQNQAALAAGGAIIGGFILYKLVKWILNAFNKNTAASNSISSNIKAIVERGENLRFSNETVDKLKKDVLTHVKSLKGVETEQLKVIVSAIESVKTASGVALLKAFSESSELHTGLWQMLITGTTKVGTVEYKLTDNPNFTKTIENIANTLTDTTSILAKILNDLKSMDKTKPYQGDDIGRLQENLKSCMGILSSLGINVGNVNQTDGLGELIFDHASKLTNKTSVYTINDNHASDYINRIQKFADGDTFMRLNEPLEEVEELSKKFNDKEIVEKIKDVKTNWMGVEKENKEKLNNTVKNSYIGAYSEAAKVFKVYTRVLAAIRLLQNNYGKGLIAINRAQDKLIGIS